MLAIWRAPALQSADYPFHLNAGSGGLREDRILRFTMRYEVVVPLLYLYQVVS